MEQKDEIICVTTDTVPGRNISKVMGMVIGVSVTEHNADLDGATGRSHPCAPIRACRSATIRP